MRISTVDPSKIGLNVNFFRRLLYKPILAIALLLLSILFSNTGIAQGPCSAHRWTKGAQWNADGSINDRSNVKGVLGIIRCGSSAETEQDLQNFKTSYNSNLFSVTTGPNCEHPDGGSTPVTNPVNGQDIIWVNFDIRPYAGTFQYQITPGGNELGWALYVSKTRQAGVGSNGLSGSCAKDDLVYVKCGISANGWITTSTSDGGKFTEPANYYLAIWRNNGQNFTNQNVTLKGRYGCGEAFCTLESAAAVTTTCNLSNNPIDYTVKIPLQGSGGQFLVDDLNSGIAADKATKFVVTNYDKDKKMIGSPSTTTTEPTITFGTYTGGAIFIDVEVTYPNNKAYDIVIKPATVSTSCTATLPFSGSAPNCCVAPTVDTHPVGSTKCAGSSTSFSVAYTGGSPAPSIVWQVSTNSGSTWTNLTNTSPYSNVETTTLGISDVTGLNGYQYRATLTSGQCDAVNSNAATLTVDAPPTIASVGSDQNRCGVLISAGLGGNTPISGTGTWTKKSGPGTVSFSANANTPNATATVSVAGIYVFTWTIHNGVCTDSKADITVNYFAPLSAPSVCVIQPSLCGPTTGKVQFTSLGEGYQYSIKDGAEGSWQDCNVFINVNAGDVTGLRVRNSAGCVSDAANCNITCTGDPQPCLATPIMTKVRSNEVILNESEIGVKAFPNPFGDRISFQVSSPVSGQGSLEVFNTLGQKVKTVYQGNIIKGMQQFELQLPAKQNANLVYILRVGDKQTNGKILQLKQ